MSAPVIQPSNPAGGASLAPGAGNAGANTTINPTETQVQQQAAAAQAAQQASVAYRQRERDVRDYTDALVDYHDLPGEFRSTEAPDRTMIERRGTEIASRRAQRGVDLAANARAGEAARFAGWEEDQAFEGDKLHRARDYLYYQRGKASASTTSYFNRGMGTIEADVLDVQKAYNEARLNNRDFTWDGPKYSAEQMAQLEASGMPDWQSSQWMRQSRLANPTSGRAGILLDPMSQESQAKLDAEFQNYLNFLNTPLTFENKVYMPRVSPQRIAADAAQNAARVEYNEAQNASLAGRLAMAESMGVSLQELGKIDAAYRARAAAEPLFSPQTIDLSGMDVQQKHEVMTSLGLRTFDQLDQYVDRANADIVRAHGAGYSSPAEMRAAEKAEWTAYQNRGAAEQTNPVLREYAVAAQNGGVYDELGAPQGLVRAPTLSNAEKYGVLNKYSGGEYMYDPIKDQISKKNVVDTSEYVAPEIWDVVINSAPLKAVRDFFNTDNLPERLETQKKAEGVVAGDKTGRGFLYGVSEFGVGLPHVLEDSLVKGEYIVKNPSQLHYQNWIKNVNPAIYDLANMAATDPHRMAGIVTGSALISGIGGAGIASTVSRVSGSVKKAGLHADIVKAGGNLKTTRAIETIGSEAQKIPPEIIVEPRLAEVRNIGPQNAGTVLNAIRDQDVTLYGTSVNVGQKVTPPRTTSDIDLFIQPENTDIIKQLAANLGDGYKIQNIAILREVEPGKYAHAIDTHTYPAGYPAKNPVAKNKYTSSYTQNDLYYPFKVIPDRESDVVAAAGIRMESDAIQSARKAAASLYHKDNKGTIQPGPMPHRAKDVWDLVADTEYKIQVERNRTRNPIRLRRAAKLEKALNTIKTDPQYRTLLETAERDLLESGQLAEPRYTTPGITITQPVTIKRIPGISVAPKTKIEVRSAQPRIRVITRGYRTYTNPLTKRESKLINKTATITLASAIPSIKKIASSPRSSPIIPEGYASPSHIITTERAYTPPTTPTSYVPPITPATPVRYVPPTPPTTPPPYTPPTPPTTPTSYVPPITPATPVRYVPPTPSTTPPPYTPPTPPTTPPPYAPFIIRRKTPPPVIISKRRKRDLEKERLSRYRIITPQNLDHRSILDPLQAINPNTPSYMTNPYTPAATRKLYEYDGILNLTPPAWAQKSPRTRRKSPKNKPVKTTKSKNKPQTRRKPTRKSTQKRRK